MKHELESFVNSELISWDAQATIQDFFSLFFPFQPSKHDALLGSPNYVHKIHGAAKAEGKNGLEGTPTPAKTNELWSVAKLSLECNNNTKDDNRSFYQQLNQMHQRNFHQHHHVDISSSASHS